MHACMHARASLGVGAHACLCPPRRVPHASCAPPLPSPAAVPQAYGIVFNSLLALNNMPVKRFADWLAREGQMQAYMELLVNAFNPGAGSALMCRRARTHACMQENHKITKFSECSKQQDKPLQQATAGDKAMERRVGSFVRSCSRTWRTSAG